MTYVPLRPSSLDTGDLGSLRASILRHLAGVVRTVGIDEHELGCWLSGDVNELHVALTGPPLLGGLRQALGVRVLDAVREDGRTFGTVAVDVLADDPR